MVRVLALVLFVVVMVSIPNSAKSDRQSTDRIPAEYVQNCLERFGFSKTRARINSLRVPVLVDVSLPADEGLYANKQITIFSSVAPCHLVWHEFIHYEDDVNGNWGQWDFEFQKLANSSLLTQSYLVMRDYPGDYMHWNIKLLDRIGFKYYLFPDEYKGKWFPFALKERQFVPFIR